jgi:hypothetical protein
VRSEEEVEVEPGSDLCLGAPGDRSDLLLGRKSGHVVQEYRRSEGGSITFSEARSIPISYEQTAFAALRPGVVTPPVCAPWLASEAKSWPRVSAARPGGGRGWESFSPGPGRPDLLEVGQVRRSAGLHAGRPRATVESWRCRDADEPGLSTTTSYSYDGYGNRVERNATGGAETGAGSRASVSRASVSRRLRPATVWGSLWGSPTPKGADFGGFGRTTDECVNTPKNCYLQPFWLLFMMERTGIEPVTPSLQSWCSPS